ncbi:hypothetical protein SEA_OZZYJ_62 [Streptomyces phage OzzyJ]|nr:hypothetical protein SEA_OZZYJ_62 [Streptomyces phage OzzyJ]
MSRADSGWEYGEWGARWAPTTEIAIAEMTVGLYGDEYTELRRQLDDLVRAVRRDVAEELRDHEVPDVMGKNFYVPLGLGYAADLVMPDYPEED